MDTMELETIKPHFLARIFPLNRLRKDLLDALIPELRIETLPAGHQLFDIGESPDDYYYVLEGSVALIDQTRSLLSPVGPISEEMAMPLPYVVPSPHRARTATECRMLRVKRRQLLEAMERQKANPARLPNSSFWDNLPPDDLRERTERRATAERDAPPPRPERILLVEDHPTDATIAQMMLKRLGYSATWVRTCADALIALEIHTYDIVLLDVQLPGVDGFEGTRRIRERWPRSAGPRIVALTARALQGDREACLAAGMDDYIAKPISIHMLAAKLSSENWELVDAAVVQRFAGVVGKAGMSQLIDAYVAGWPDMVDDVRMAIERRDAPVLRRTAHTLKAAAETLGVRVVAGYALKLEHVAQSGTVEGAPALLGQIDSVRPEMIRELDRIRGQLLDRTG